MSKEKEEILDDEEVSQEELEKALDNALDILNKAKTEKANPPNDEEDEYGEEEEEEEKETLRKKKTKKSEEEPDFDALSKSLEEGVLESDEEAQEILDAVPFVKALMDTLEEQISELIKAVVYVSDKVDKVAEELEKSEKIDIAEAKLIKSMSENIRKMSEAPIPRKSVLGKGLEIIQKSETGEEIKKTFSKSEALEKLTELHKAGKLSLDDVIKTEGRLNKGMEIPGRILNLLTS